MKNLLVLLNLLFIASFAKAQEINFSRIQDMAIWYNQSLKTDKNSAVKLNMRNVRYDGMMAYKSISGMVDFPLLSAAGKEAEHSGYLSISAGGASDKSNEGILNNTMGLFGISYAIPIAPNEIYLAVGVQGSYYQSRLNINGEPLFGDQFDQYGPVEGMTSGDRLASGWAYNHFDFNAGISAFSNSQYNKWHIGASLMHINKAYTDDAKSDDFRLNYLLSIQGGYKYITPQNDYCAFYTTLNWQGKALKHFFNVSFQKAIPGMDAGVGLGLGYRYEDALVPNVEFRYSKLMLSLGYDVNVSAFNPAGFKRNGTELAVKFDF